MLLSVTGDLLSQNYSQGHTEICLVDGGRGNRRIDVEIFYPADRPGDNVPVPVNSSGFPVLCFTHGYLMKWDSYTFIRDALVPEGYIIAFPKTGSGLFPSHEELGRDISFILEKFSSFSTDSTSMFYGRTGRKSCAMGHSMGGGSSVLAASYDSSVDAIALLAPLETRPSAAGAAHSVEVPALIFTGEKDCITKPASNQIPIYESLKSQSKILITIKGGTHCQMAGKSIACSMAETLCSKNGRITRAEQQEIIMKYLLPWLNFHMKGDTSSARIFRCEVQSDTNVYTVEDRGITF